MKIRARFLNFAARQVILRAGQMMACASVLLAIEVCWQSWSAAARLRRPWRVVSDMRSFMLSLEPVATWFGGAFLAGALFFVGIQFLRPPARGQPVLWPAVAAALPAFLCAPAVPTVLVDNSIVVSTVVPYMIVVLCVASLGLLALRWLSEPDRKDDAETVGDTGGLGEQVAEGEVGRSAVFLDLAAVMLAGVCMTMAAGFAIAFIVRCGL